MADREVVVERERRWLRPAGIAALVSFALLVVGEIVVRSVSGDGQAEVLRSAEEHSSQILASGVLKALSFLLLVAPLTVLFRAAQARAPQVRGQLIGLVVAAPLFLAASAVLTVVATNEAASDFVAGKVTSDLTSREAIDRCESDRDDDPDAFTEDYGKGTQALRGCTRDERADEAAEDAVTDAGARSLAEGFGLGGRLGLAFALIYSSLWAMRTGLLTRFWGSLGMAMGVAAFLLLIQFTFIWFLYLGLLLVGSIPGGRPPAWAEGRAIPWPSPGEQAASRLEDPDEGVDDGMDQPPAERGADPGQGDRPSDDGPPRKRKRRD